MIFLAGILAFYLAWNLGGNDVANSMGTSVGSKALTLRQAIAIAGVLEFLGAVFFGQRVSERLITGVVSPERFAHSPQLFLIGMLSVLLTCGLWMNLATGLGMPVSSSHAIVGAIAGFGWVTGGSQVVDWRSLGIISLTWIVTPLVSGSLAALAYRLIRLGILEQAHPLKQLQEWIPWLSAILFSIFGVIVLPSLTRDSLELPLPVHTIALVIGATATLGLSQWLWSQMSHLSDSEATQGLPERFLAQFQVLSAGFVAFAHGSNDVGNAIAPLAAIVTVLANGQVPVTTIQIPLWVLVLGGLGIVGGLAVWGKQVIQTIGEGITSLQPSGGFCAELATATTVLLASRFGLPVSTSHALVGGVIGVGLVRGTGSIQGQTIRQIALVWLVTLPVVISGSAIVFQILQWGFQFMPGFLNV